MDYRWQEEKLSYLGLGTAQFDGEYGIAHAKRELSPCNFESIVEQSWDRGITFFDTAQAYGGSENILGRCLERLKVIGQAKVISKLSPEVDWSDDEAVYKSVCISCERLRGPLWGLMLHRSEWLQYWGGRMSEALIRARDEGLVRYLGFSGYSPPEAAQGMACKDVRIVQIPVNGIDWSASAGGVFEIAAKAGVLCLGRSVFLQGLLTMSPERAKLVLPQATVALETWAHLCDEMGLTPTQLSMGVCRSLGIPLVMGVDNSNQLAENLGNFHHVSLSDQQIRRVRDRMRPFALPEIIDPRKWETK